MHRYTQADEDPARTGYHFAFFADYYCRRHLAQRCSNCWATYGMPSVAAENQGDKTLAACIQGYRPLGPILGRRDDLLPDEVAQPTPPLASTALAPPAGLGIVDLAHPQPNPPTAIRVSRQPTGIAPQQTSFGNHGLDFSSGDINSQPSSAQRDSVVAQSQNSAPFLESTGEKSLARDPSSLVDGPHDVQITGIEQRSTEEDDVLARLFPEHVSTAPPETSSDPQQTLPDTQAVENNPPAPPIASPLRSIQYAQPAPTSASGWRSQQLTLTFIDRESNFPPRLDTATPFFLLSRTCKIQIRLGDGEPVSVKAPDVPLICLMDEIFPNRAMATIEELKKRNVRRVQLDKGVYTKNTIKGARWPTRISNLVLEDYTGGLKLTFYNGTTCSPPKEGTLQWPGLPPPDSLTAI